MGERGWKFETSYVWFRLRGVIQVMMLATLAALCGMIGCSAPSMGNMVFGDIRPPIVKNAKLSSGGKFIIEFDEPVSVHPDSFSVSPDSLSSHAEGSGSTIAISFEPPPSPGECVTLGGNVQDLVGNSTRIQVQFKGYNERPAGLVISELQLAKNTSKRAPHRDYIELYVVREGNLGGMSVQWASTVKRMRYDFPPCEVKAGEVIVVHCAPEGVPLEVDETGSDLAHSGGIDATTTGRDLWSNAGGLPDGSGAIAVYAREGEDPLDGVFYAESEKSGAMDSSKLSSLVQELVDAGVWDLAAPLNWEGALHWKPSTAKSLVRLTLEKRGVAVWGVSESGGQSPGLVVRSDP